MRHGTRIALIVCLLVLISCGAARVGGQIRRSERRWQRHDIGSYQIEVALISATWHYQTQVVTVRDGEVVDVSASCVTAPMETALGAECEVQDFDPDIYTVPGLFTLARALTESNPRRDISIDFDDTYGFPTRISYDRAEVVDEEQSWVAGAFEVLE